MQFKNYTMILDKIENVHIYKNLWNARFGQALNYLQNFDFNWIKPGKYEIDGENIYMLVQEYITKEIIECNLEGHQKYIDIQYVLSGSELIGVTILKEQLPFNGQYENDCAFFESDKSFLKLEAGMFAIFFPDDLHMPCLKISECSKVKKIVIKVLK